MSPKGKRPPDGGFLLPLEIDPARRCVQLHIPDDVNHIRAFWGALEELQYWFSWQRDDDHTAALVAAVWKDVISLARALFESDNPCPCEDDPMAECCEDILERLDAILSLLQSPRSGDPVLVINFRQDILNILNDPSFAVTDLHPSAPDVSYTEGTGDSGVEVERAQALCHVLWLVCLAIAAKLRANIVITGLQLALDVALTGWFTGAGGVLLITAGLQELVRLALEDEGAIRNVVCCMADELIGQPTTRANVQTAALACEVGGNETLIGEAISAWFADDVNWGAFVRDLGAAFDQILAGASLYCPCSEDGETCEDGLTYTQFEYDYAGENGWTPDSIGGACAGFGHILEGGGELVQTVERCIRLAQLNRFFGGTSDNEATLAKFTINGHVQYAPIVAGQHCTVAFDPPQTIGPDHSLRVDLLGGGERMCYTGFIVQMATPT